MPFTIHNVCSCLFLSVSVAFIGQPTLPAFGLHHRRRPRAHSHAVQRGPVVGSAAVVPTTRGTERRRLVPRAVVDWRRHAVADGQRVVVPAIAQWRDHLAASLCYARVAASTGLVWVVHAIAAPLQKQLGCTHFAAASLDHCIQLSRLFLGLARRQKKARVCLRRL